MRTLVHTDTRARARGPRRRRSAGALVPCRRGAWPVALGVLLVLGAPVLACSSADVSGTVLHLVDLQSGIDRPVSPSLAVARAKVGGISKEVFAIPDSLEPDVHVEAFVVPEDAFLEFSIGAKGRPRRPDQRPLTFRVTALEAEREEILAEIVAGPKLGLEWTRHRVDLAAWAGRKLALRFSVRLPSGQRAPRDAGVWGSPTVVQRAGQGGPPNVVLISLDTLRARSLGTYGNRRATDPGFRALSTRGTLFADASTTYSNTFGGHIGMLTGRYKWSPHVRPSRPMPAGRGLFLAEQLRASGRATAAFTEDGLLNGRSGFWNGFETYYENTAVGRGSGAAEDTFARAGRWISEHRSRPFFLFVHTYEVHAPYRPPDTYRDLLPEPYDEFEKAREGPAAKPGDVESPEAATHYRRLYEGEIRYLDDLLVALIEKADASLEDRPTLFVITADHGEEFLEHGSMLHVQIYQEIMHVPLLMIFDGVIPAGRRVERPVSLVDLKPTILALVGAEAAGTRAPTDGVDLTPLLETPPRPIERAPILAMSPGTDALGPGTEFAARQEASKCIYKSRTDETVCFDLSVDPGERAPRAPEDAAGFPPLVDAIEAYRERLRVARQIGGSPRAPAPDEAAEALDEATREKLRALGYLEDEPAL